MQEARYQGERLETPLKILRKVRIRGSDLEPRQGILINNQHLRLRQAIDREFGMFVNTERNDMLFVRGCYRKYSLVHRS